jgi:hypothetical protein
MCADAAESDSFRYYRGKLLAGGVKYDVELYLFCCKILWVDAASYTNHADVSGRVRLPSGE